jgi:hypothetical protein
VYCCHPCAQPLRRAAPTGCQLEDNLPLHPAKKCRSAYMDVAQYFAQSNVVITIFAQFSHCLCSLCCRCAASSNLLVDTCCHSAVYDDAMSAQQKIPHAFVWALWVWRAPCCSYGAGLPYCMTLQKITAPCERCGFNLYHTHKICAAFRCALCTHRAHQLPKRASMCVCN